MVKPVKGRFVQRWIPARVVFVALGFLGFCLTYAYKVVLSMAIVAMVKTQENNGTGSEDSTLNGDMCPGNKEISHNSSGEFDWDDNVKNLVLASFFYGYVLTQFPAGILANKFGGKWIFGLSLFFTAFCCLVGPFAARQSALLFGVTRFIQGLAEGVVYPCMSAMIARWMPKMERTRGTTIIFTGAMIGTVFILPVAAQLNQSSLGWPSSFYLLGGIGITWFAIYSILVYESPEVHPFISQAEHDYIIKNGGGMQNEVKMSIPFRQIFTSVPVYGLIAVNFGQNVAFLLVLTYMPTYMSDVLHTSNSQNTLLSPMPYLGQALFSWLCSYFTDKARASGRFEITTIRKFNSFIAYIPAAICLALVPTAGCNKILSCVFLILAITFNGACFSAFNSTHVDMTPDFAGTLMGLTNGIGNIPGFAVPKVVDLFTRDKPTVSSWSYVFYMAAGVNVLTAIIYQFFCTAREQPWGRMRRDEESDVKQ